MSSYDLLAGHARYVVHCHLLVRVVSAYFCVIQLVYNWCCFLKFRFVYYVLDQFILVCAHTEFIVTDNTLLYWWGVADHSSLL